MAFLARRGQGSRRRHRLLVGCGSVLGSALCLELGGVEDAIVAVGSDRQRLGVVLEGVRWGFGATVGDLQCLPLFQKGKGGVGPGTLDAAGSDIASHAQMTDICLVTHALKLANSHVVALVIAHASDCEICHRRQNDDRRNDDLQRTLAGRVRHTLFHSTERTQATPRGDRPQKNCEATELSAPCGVTTGIYVVVPQEDRMGDVKLDLLQGTLDLMVLQTLAAMGKVHGYGIARRIEQVSGDEVLLNQGTIYAALVRLQQRGWIEAEWGASENNRKAKFYSITKRGRKQLADDTAYWMRLSGVMERVLAMQAEEAQ